MIASASSYRLEQLSFETQVPGVVDVRQHASIGGFDQEYAVRGRPRRPVLIALPSDAHVSGVSIQQGDHRPVLVADLEATHARAVARRSRLKGTGQDQIAASFTL